MMLVFNSLHTYWLLHKRLGLQPNHSSSFGRPKSPQSTVSRV